MSRVHLESQPHHPGRRAGGSPGTHPDGLRALMAFVPGASGGNDDLQVTTEVTGWACFAQGDTPSTCNIAGVYDIDTETAAFATLSGRGVTVQYVRLNPRRDAVAVIRTKPAAYDVCAWFHLRQMNTFGWSPATRIGA